MPEDDKARSEEIIMRQIRSQQESIYLGEGGGTAGRPRPSGRG